MSNVEKRTGEDMGGANIFQDQPKRDLSQGAAETPNTPPCGARTRSGMPCSAPAMPNGRCHAHGGLSPGAPRGAANGRFKDGFWTQEAVEERKFIRVLLKGTPGGKS